MTVQTIKNANCTIFSPKTPSFTSTLSTVDKKPLLILLQRQFRFLVIYVHIKYWKFRADPQEDQSMEK